MILVQSTSIFSEFRCASDALIDIEKESFKLLEQHGIQYTVIWPTMIYGSLGDNNMSTFIKMVDKLRLFPIVKQGKALLQPVHMADIGRALWLVYQNPQVANGKTYIISGEKPMQLIEIFHVIEEQLGHRNIYINIPIAIASIGVRGLRFITRGKKDYVEKLFRLTENRNFEHEAATQDFGFLPISFEDGIKGEINDYRAAQRK